MSDLVSGEGDTLASYPDVRSPPGTVAPFPPVATALRTLVPGDENAHGWCDVHLAGGEELILRNDIGGRVEHDPAARPISALLHLSDLHVMDVQSPSRLEYLDRHSDPDSDYRSAYPAVGTYRANDMLTTQVVGEMVSTLNRSIRDYPVPIEAAVLTGDVIDNCQQNEMRNYLALLDGGLVIPDSGNPTRYEGVAAGAISGWDDRYWRPERGISSAVDLPRKLYGYPEIPGLLDACRRPFYADRLELPWFAVYGNHDALAGGTVPITPAIEALSVGNERYLGLGGEADVLAVLGLLHEVGPAAYPDVAVALRAAVSPDSGRHHMALREFVMAHLASSGGHGFSDRNVAEGTANWYRDLEGVRLISMNSVNPHGGWQGSFDRAQLAWLEDRLREVSGVWLSPDGRRTEHRVEDRLVVVLSHHPSDCLVNGWEPDGLDDRVLGDEFRQLLLRYPNVVLWLNGHTHRNRIVPHPRPRGWQADGGFWEVTTPSHIDWPQQSRLVDIRQAASGDLAIGTTVIDHDGVVQGPWDTREPAHLAGLSRTLSVNNWQRRGARRFGNGARGDRNVLLALPAPFPLAVR